MNQLVYLNAYKSTDIYINDSSIDKIERRRRVIRAFRTAYHEYTHFLDFTTSSYGLNFMDVLFAAAEDYTKGCKSPLDSPSALELIHLCADMDKDEMHSQQKRAEVGQPWEYRNAPMDSRRSENDPEVYMTIMTMYSKRVNGKLNEFARAPLSILAMLESNAVFNELFFAHAANVTEESSVIQRSQEVEKFTQESLNFFYTSSFLTYSTSVHFVANSLNETDIVIAAGITSYLTRFCLDLTEVTMSGFTLRENLIDPNYSELYDRIQSEVRSGSRTLAFYLLTLAAARVAPNADQDKWILDVAQYAGFNNPLLETKKFKRRIMKRLNARTTSNPQFAGLLKILEHNGKIEYRGGLYNFPKYALPCTLLKDQLLFHPHAPDRAGINVAEDMGFNPVIHFTWMNQFSSWLSS